MYSKTPILFALCSVLAFGQDVTAPSVNVPSSQTNPAIICAKAKDVLESRHESKVVVEMVIDTGGKLDSFKILSPKGLHLEKDPDVRNAFQKMRFDPARKDGQAVRSIASMTFNCSFDPSRTGATSPAPSQ
ncbi:MAG TPA: energy transducer TonB [Terriglobales bacterium]|jgi:TonB family protein|nr:energy transducer TonB [Terriglobales bacterium]